MARVFASETLTCEAEGLAGVSAAEQVDSPPAFPDFSRERVDVFVLRDIGPLLSKDSSAIFVQLYLADTLHAGALKPKVNRSHRFLRIDLRIVASLSTSFLGVVVVRVGAVRPS